MSVVDWGVGRLGLGTVIEVDNADLGTFEEEDDAGLGTVCEVCNTDLGSNLEADKRRGLGFVF